MIEGDGMCDQKCVIKIENLIIKKIKKPKEKKKQKESYCGDFVDPSTWRVKEEK